MLGEFIEESVPTYYREALREHDLAPITEPDIELGDVEEGKPLVFTAVVEVRPRLKLDESDYRGVKVERPAVEISDEDVDRYLDSLRERFAELETVSRTAREGDYVVVDLHAAVHGEEIPEATRPDHLYAVGSGEFGDKLDAELAGKRAGEILAFNDTLGPGAGERAGQEVSFRVLVKEVKGKKLPEADDEFAKTASEFDTLEELKAELREQLRQNRERSVDADVRDRVLQAMIDTVDVDLPDSLVDEETRAPDRARAGARRAGGDDAGPVARGAGVRRAAVPRRRARPRDPRDQGRPGARGGRAPGGDRGHGRGDRSRDRRPRRRPSDASRRISPRVWTGAVKS